MFSDIKLDAWIGSGNDRKLEVSIWIISGMFYLTLQEPSFALCLSTIRQNIPVQIDA